MANKYFLIGSLILSTSFISGCSLSLGQEEFTCPNLKKGGVCGGPRDVYELTNNRVSLEGLTDEELAAYRAQQKGQTVSTQPSPEAITADNRDDVVYEARSENQQQAGGYDVARALPQAQFETADPNGYERWPSNGEPLAPEPLAVLQPAEVMRVLVTAYTDEYGYANMPGYVYVEVTPRQWAFGKAANMRPSRIVPFQLRQESQAELQRKRQRARGVDPMEVINPINRDN